MISDRLPEILNRLEDLELKTLAWGITGVTLTAAEVSGVLSDAVMANQFAGVFDGPDESQFLNQLLTRALLHRVPNTSPPEYRTRLGEGVRLLKANKQLFPPRKADTGNNWWTTGRNLVADFRIDVEPRRYPRRDLAAKTVLGTLRALDGWNADREKLATRIIGERDLAAFQLSAMTAILRSLDGDVGRGVVVGAGTGSGKTLAFYLPAFASLATTLRNPPAGTSVLALYPRKELLRDQAQEAVTMSLRVAASTARPVRVALLYADTPSHCNAHMLTNANGAWKRVGEALKCPYFSCVKDGCGGDLLWSDADRGKSREALTCAQCKAQYGPELLALTRESISSRPPDVLFTTTEMLSRQASDRSLGRCLGWTGTSSPRLVLLDEVHTYSGTQGAQVGLMLRRWQHSRRQRGLVPAVFVGLSATLRDAPRFFAELTGLREEAVEYIEPSPDELEPIGRQYTLVLRGDPVSEASLLSTSLQTAMLAGRLLNPSGSEDLFGSTGFIFTDDLDVTNRFYNDLRDAEGRQTRFKPGVARAPVLAQLRSPDYAADGVNARYADRYADGQAWTLVRDIGRSLSGTLNDGALRIGRTSSQDAGVAKGSDLIVATASLEVGFNDPTVGLVIQHKAPHDHASFVQRKGRAGRRTDMRPITIVVLSDYGRDRVTYQGYEQLFSPTVPASHLPVGNRHVQRIQAAHSLLDWLSRRLALDVRATLRTPESPGQSTFGSDKVAQALRDLLSQPGMQDELARHLEKSLHATSNDVQALLWDEPRSLLFSVIPTALRRLESNWTSVDEDPGFRPRELLPEHLTQSLFAELNTPDVTLGLPFETKAEVPTMPILSALREAIPGKVSRRFSIEKDEHRTWLPVPEDGLLDIRDIVKRGHALGEWAADGEKFQVVRPLALNLEMPPTTVDDRSNGFPTWKSEILIPAGDNEGLVPLNAPWADVVAGVKFALHATGESAEVRRMAVGAVGELVYRDNSRSSYDVSLVNGDESAALGFSLEADALVVQVRRPDRENPGLLRYANSNSWRTLSFRTRLQEARDLNGVANSFQRDWLALLYLTALGLNGKGKSRTVLKNTMDSGAWVADVPMILSVMYRTDESGSTPAGLSQRIQDLLAEQGVVTCLNTCASVLYSNTVMDDTWPLLERCYSDTWAAVLRTAVLRLIGDADDMDLVVDVIPVDASDQTVSIVVSETAMGGLGLIESLRSSYAADPSRLWSAVGGSIGATDYENVDAAIRTVLSEIERDPTGNCASAVAAYRSASGAIEASAALSRLIEAWTELVGPPPHLAVSAFGSRFLRPGSDSSTDAAALRLVEIWDELEASAGAEVDARVVAYAATDPKYGNLGLNADQAFSMLWPRGFAARNSHLEHWQPYVSTKLIDRLILAACIDHEVEKIDLDDSEWFATFQSVLQRLNDVDLVVDRTKRDLLGAAIRRIPVLPIDRGPIRIYARLARVSVLGPTLTARVTVSEIFQ